MEGKRNRSDSATNVLSKKIKITNQIETLAAGEIPDLLPEIIIGILARLPVKSLFRCRCVSKSWLSLISSSEFINAHLNHSARNPNFTNHRIMFTLSDTGFNLKHCSVQSLMSGHATAASNIDYPRKSPHRAVWVVGSCNGIICIAINEKNVYLWNPTMGKSKKLPPATAKLRKDFYYMWGLGYEDCDDDYKVVGIFCVFDNAGAYESVVKIYSLKSNSWKRIEDFRGGTPLDDSGKFVGGKLHFAATPGIPGTYLDSEWNIVSLDLKSEVYGVVEQPNYGEGGCDSSLGVLGGCLCVLCNHQKTRADVWVMKEYDVKESWTKVVSIPYADDPGKVLYNRPLVMLPNGEILLVIAMQLVVYNPRDNSFRCPEMTNVDSFLEADVYVESLVSLQGED